MSYIAKYLPEDGNVKEAKMVFYKGEVYEHVHLLNNKDPKEYTFIRYEGQLSGYHEKWTALTIAKLYLCSNDIQLGNDVIGINMEGEFIKGELVNIGEFFCRIDENAPSDDMTEVKDTYKIIGEVSSKATWVKDGMLFEESDFRMLLINQGYKIEQKSLEYVPESDRDNWKPHIQFKCKSCSTFI